MLREGWEDLALLLYTLSGGLQDVLCLSPGLCLFSVWFFFFAEIKCVKIN